MDKNKIIRILEYYLPEEKEYLFYENHMYPRWVKRANLINLISNEILKDKDSAKEECQICTIRKNE
jgi:hypothetical protein